MVEMCNWSHCGRFCWNCKWIWTLRFTSSNTLILNWPLVSKSPWNAPPPPHFPTKIIKNFQHGIPTETHETVGVYFILKLGHMQVGTLFFWLWKHKLHLSNNSSLFLFYLFICLFGFCLFVLHHDDSLTSLLPSQTFSSLLFPQSTLPPFLWFSCHMLSLKDQRRCLLCYNFSSIQHRFWLKSRHLIIGKK